ncbi:hypothetical protein GWK08_16010 [Leptobacterium flavescens]|uniref:Uncharacterized protein n=1 Tax=Leptobacterium flavescens TaxID=472055 RepID=A0A6P0UR01_9FLAO|nr:hypothetical protein [Leptobacterium flavescens]NER14962.1 hypothetical protein [Leptobacterium flavescens]
MKKLILLCFCLSITLGHTQTEDFDYGSIENNIYSNDFFKLRLSLPENWVVQSKEQSEKLMELGKDLVAGDDQSLRRVIKASEVNSAQLLTVFKHELGAAVEYNPAFMLLAENIKHAPGVKSGKDYLFHSRNLLKRSQMQLEFVSDTFELVKIGGRDFYRMDIGIQAGGMIVKQSYFSTVINRFSLSFIYSYRTDEQKEELANVLQTLKFND